MQIVSLDESTGDTVIPGNERMLLAVRKSVLLSIGEFFFSLLKKKTTISFLIPIKIHSYNVPAVLL